MPVITRHTILSFSTNCYNALIAKDDANEIPYVMVSNSKILIDMERLSLHNIL